MVDWATYKGSLDCIIEDLLDQLAGCPGAKHQVYIRIPGPIGRENGRKSQRRGRLQGADCQASPWTPVILDGLLRLLKQVRNSDRIGKKSSPIPSARPRCWSWSTSPARPQR